MNNKENKTPLNISVEKLHEFNGHPYKVLDNEEINTLISSIQEQGILSPIIVRPLENTTNEYEIISGHRRFRAAQKVGIKEVPALVYAMSRDEAVIAVVDSNLHRENILPSEKAFAYKMKLDVLKHQGKVTSRQVVGKLESADLVADDSDSGKQVQRYIRLTNLIPEILQYVDDNKIALTPAVEISYLTKQEQQNLLETMQSEDRTPSLSQVQRMKVMSQEGRLDMDKIFEIMTETKPNQKEKISLCMEDVRKFFPQDYTPKQMNDTIMKLLSNYKKKLDRTRSDFDER